MQQLFLKCFFSRLIETYCCHCCSNIVSSVLCCAEWRPRLCSIPCSTSSAPPSQTMQSASSSVVTCKELCSPHVTTSIARRLQNRSVQADNVDISWPVCHAVSMSDVAVEVGESLLASGSQRHDHDIVLSSFMSSVMTAAVQNNPICTTSMTDAAAVPQSCLGERLSLDLQNRSCRQQIETTAALNQLPSHVSDSNPISESSPVIVIVPDESASQEYRLSCDEQSSCEENAELSGPLDNLAQSEADASLVQNTVPC